MNADERRWPSVVLRWWLKSIAWLLVVGVGMVAAAMLSIAISVIWFGFKPFTANSMQWYVVLVVGVVLGGIVTAFLQGLILAVARKIHHPCSSAFIRGSKQVEP